MIAEIILLLILVVGGLAYYYHYHYDKDADDEEEESASSSPLPPPEASRSTAQVRVSPMPVLEPAPEPLPPMAAPVAEMIRLLPSHIRGAIHYASKEAPCGFIDLMRSVGYMDILSRDGETADNTVVAKSVVEGIDRCVNAFFEKPVFESIVAPMNENMNMLLEDVDYDFAMYAMTLMVECSRYEQDRARIRALERAKNMRFYYPLMTDNSHVQNQTYSKNNTRFNYTINTWRMHQFAAPVISMAKRGTVYEFEYGIRGSKTEYDPNPTTGYVVFGLTNKPKEQTSSWNAPGPDLSINYKHGGDRMYPHTGTKTPTRWTVHREGVGDFWRLTVDFYGGKEQYDEDGMILKDIKWEIFADADRTRRLYSGWMSAAEGTDDQFKGYLNASNTFYIRIGGHPGGWHYFQNFDKTVMDGAAFSTDTVATEQNPFYHLVKNDGACLREYLTMPVSEFKTRFYTMMRTIADNAYAYLDMFLFKDIPGVDPEELAQVKLIIEELADFKQYFDNGILDADNLLGNLN